MTMRNTLCRLVFIALSVFQFAPELLAQKYVGKRLEILVPSETSVYATEPIDLYTEEWVRSTQSVPNLGNSDAWIWARIDLDPVMDAGLSVEIAYATIDSLQVFMVCDGVVESVRLAGATIPQSSRDQLLGNYPSFPIPVLDCNTLTCYIKAWSGKQILLPVRIEGSRKLLFDGHNRDVFFALYIGIVMALLVYNLFLFIVVKDINYLYYVLFIFTVGCTQIVLNGYERVLELVANPWLALRVTHIFGILSGVCSILFVRSFLHLKTKAPIYYKIFGFFYIPYFISFVLLYAGYFNISYDFINIPAMSIIILIPASIKVWREGDESAGYFLVGWAVFIIAVLIFALKDFGIIPYNETTIYALPVGNAIELVVLSLALGSRINQLKKDRQYAREKELSTSILNERIQREHNVRLEINVSDRTLELTQINNSLQNTLEELQSAQQQVVQSEKLASIGQLTAGIAHELNNPINFVLSSALSLKRDFKDIEEVFGEIMKIDHSNSSLVEEVQNLKKKMIDLDIEFTMDEIGELVNGVENGAERTAEIVRGLRIFSRMDGKDVIEADVNELLTSTLVILRSNLRNEVDVITELSDNLPEISCQPGKLNQVFMNIITNAAHATLETTKSRAERHVRVRTRVVKGKADKYVQVEITDNGVGMSDEIIAQIFNPFFTTKNVGDGTGLGLSIVKGILDDHKATVEINSTIGEGTTFLLSFPA